MSCGTSVIRLISRRQFLRDTGVVAGGLVLAANSGAYAAATSRSANRFSPNVYVSVHKNGDVDIVCHRSEMGQGIRTCLMQIIADEMEADWDRITLLQATGDPKYGDQNTDGSTSIRNHFDMLRTVGATAREMLDDAVVRHLHNVRRKPPRPEIRQRQSRLDWRRLDSQGSLTIVDVP